ncbi:hypothetical protein HKX48_006035 [Thoreauomyces humboldtii]|nr:hypothetical protein HKX48_006035 [Thoreauomyces humboldtii]
MSQKDSVTEAASIAPVDLFEAQLQQYVDGLMTLMAAAADVEGNAPTDAGTSAANSLLDTVQGVQTMLAKLDVLKEGLDLQIPLSLVE